MSENGDLKTNLNSINNGENINNESETSEAEAAYASPKTCG